MKTLYVVGLGPGHEDYILPAAIKKIQGSDIIIGGKRHIESVNVVGKAIYEIEGRIGELPEFIKKHVLTKQVAVIVSGDTGYYSLLRYLKKKLPDVVIEATPGISSMQYLFSKMGFAWDDAFLGSVHGRQLDFVTLCSEYTKIGLLTDQKTTPQVIAKELIKNGLHHKRIIVGEHLSYEDECIRNLTVLEVINMEFHTLNAIIIVDEEVMY